MKETRATASVRFSGEMMTRSKTCSEAFRSGQHGEVMSVEVDSFEDEAEELRRVYEIMTERGGLGRNTKDPLFRLIPMSNDVPPAGHMELDV